MPAEVVARVLNITAEEDVDGYVIEFWVGQEFEDDPSLGNALALLGNLDSLQRQLFSMRVCWEGDDLTVEPDEALSDCLGVYQRYDAADPLEAPLGRMWKTGQLAEALVAHLANANVFGVWRTTPDESTQEVGQTEQTARFLLGEPTE